MAEECRASGDALYELAFAAYLRKVQQRRAEVQQAGRVPSDECWLEDSGRVLGCVRLRFRLNPKLEYEGGHVGYDVQLALPVLRQLGIRRVRVTCDEDNIGSAKIIEKNGGVLSGQGISRESGKMVRQYWIELT